MAVKVEELTLLTYTNLKHIVPMGKKMGIGVSTERVSIVLVTFYFLCRILDC